MSSLLNHLDKNRALSDEEGDSINKLFPKCKPRTSSTAVNTSSPQISTNICESVTTTNCAPTSVHLTRNQSNGYDNYTKCNANHKSREQQQQGKLINDNVGRSKSIDSPCLTSTDTNVTQNFPRNNRDDSVRCAQNLVPDTSSYGQNFTDETLCENNNLNFTTKESESLQSDSSNSNAKNCNVSLNYCEISSVPNNNNCDSVAHKSTSIVTARKSKRNNTDCYYNHHNHSSNQHNCRPASRNPKRGDSRNNHKSHHHRERNTYMHRSFKISRSSCPHEEVRRGPTLLDASSYNSPSVYNSHHLQECGSTHDHEDHYTGHGEKMIDNLSPSSTYPPSMPIDGEVISPGVMPSSMENPDEEFCDNNVNHHRHHHHCPVSGNPSSSSSTSSGSNFIGSGSNGEVFKENNQFTRKMCPTSHLETQTHCRSNIGYNPSGVGLRDSRIEIAGGREIFSQSRMRAGRRARGSSSTSSSSEMVADIVTCSAHHHAGKIYSPSLNKQQQFIPLQPDGGDGARSSNNSRSSRKKLSPVCTLPPCQSQYVLKENNISSNAHPPMYFEHCPISPESSSSASTSLVWQANSSRRKSYPSNNNFKESSSSRSTSGGHHHGFYPCDHFRNCTVKHRDGEHCCCGNPSVHQLEDAYSMGDCIEGCSHDKEAMSSKQQSSLSAEKHERKGLRMETTTGHVPSAAITIKETVFDSEITSIEKEVVAVGGADVSSLPGATKTLVSSFESPCMTSTATSTGHEMAETTDSLVYRNPFGDSEVVFDDIGDYRGENDKDGAHSHYYRYHRNRNFSKKGERYCTQETNPFRSNNDNRTSHGHHLHHQHAQSHLQLLQVLMKDDEVKVVECSGSDGTQDRKLSTRSETFPTGRNGQMMLLQQSPCGSHRGDGNTSPSGYESEEFCASTVAGALNSRLLSPFDGHRKRIIGSVPIADYEGSPKRYGLKPPTQAMPTHFDLVDVDLVTNGGNAPTAHTVGTPSSNEVNENGTNNGTLIVPTTCSSSSSLDNTHSNNVSSSGSNQKVRADRSALKGNVSPTNSFPVKMVPGFPQRVTPCDLLKSDTTSKSKVFQDKSLLKLNSEYRLSNEENLQSPEKSSDHQEVVLLGSLKDQLKCVGSVGDNSPDDSVASQKGSNNTTNSGSFDTDSMTVDQPRSTDMSLLSNFMSGDHRTSNGDGSSCTKNTYPESALVPHNYSTENLSCMDAEYMMEFSETRKVLEEFFGGPANNTSTCWSSTHQHAGDKEHLRDSDFDELNYTLKRQTGNSYVGQRLASEACAVQGTQDSPKKAVKNVLESSITNAGETEEQHRGKLSPKLISFQEVPNPLLCAPSSMASDCHSGSAYGTQSVASSRRSKSPKSHSKSPLKSPSLYEQQTRDVNDNDMDGESGSTNTDGDVENARTLIHMEPSCNCMSPETTDCDSNEYESEVSLEYDQRTRTCGLHMTSLSKDYYPSSETSDNDEMSNSGKSFMNGHKMFESATEDGNCKGSKLCNSVVSKLALDERVNKSRNHHTGNHKESQCLSNPICNESHMSHGSETDCPVHKDVSSGGSDGNPTLLLMKKQISEIENEIKQRATQHGSNDDDQCLLINVEDEPNETIVEGHNCPGNEELSNSTYEPHYHYSVDSNREPFHSVGVGNDNKSEDSSLFKKQCDGRPKYGHDHPEDRAFDNKDPELEALDPMRPTPPPSPAPGARVCRLGGQEDATNSLEDPYSSCNGAVNGFDGSGKSVGTNSNPPPSNSKDVDVVIKDIKDAIQRAKALAKQQDSCNHSPMVISNRVGDSVTHNAEMMDLYQCQESSSHDRDSLVDEPSPVWVPRKPYQQQSSCNVTDPLLKKHGFEDGADEDADTDQETDRLLGQTRNEDEYGFYDDKEWKRLKSRGLLPAISKGMSFMKAASSHATLFSSTHAAPGNQHPSTRYVPAPTSASMGNSYSQSHSNSSSGGNLLPAVASSTSETLLSGSGDQHHGIDSGTHSPTTSSAGNANASSTTFKDCSHSQLPSSLVSAATSKSKKDRESGKKKRNRDGFLENSTVLIEGVLFRARYLGSTQLTTEGLPTKETRMTQAEEAVSRIKDEGTVNGISCEKGNDDESSCTALAPCPVPPSNSLGLPKKCDSRGCEYEDYLYPEDDDSCCEVESLEDGEIFQKSAQCSRTSSMSLENEPGLGLRPCHEGMSPKSITNRQASLNSTETNGSVPNSLHLGPPCGSALPGTMFRLRFVGSVEVEEEVDAGKRSRRRPKKTMVEEAVTKIKAPEGETQPSTEVDLFISTEKIMVLNTDLKEIMMDHALRTISYIADIGDLVVLMARRRPVPSDECDESKVPLPPKMICHVFESEEAQYIAQSIGQAFQVAYMEFLKANGIEDHSFVREMDYQEVLNSQEIFGDELQMFAKKELQKEVVVPKAKGEILGVVIVESGWGSMLPTVVIANLAPGGAAARCGQLNIGDQIIAINGISLVGLPLSTCQNYIKNSKNQTVVKLTVVPCPPVVEVKIKRPDTKYQLGFSVQNGVICSLLRGGIAERGGVRVGHRIIEINNQSVVAVPHEKIVNLLATSVGEINMKTMPTSMFRLLTGQETPLYI